MKRFGIVSYNIYGNFTNYGSALQSYALHQAINRIAPHEFESVLVDYCPDILLDKDPLNPMKNMWDKDDESVRMCTLSLPAIKENYKKFNKFYTTRFNKTKKKYTSRNFNDILKDEQLNGFVCGSDTIFCMDEFGFDDGYYANYPCMKNSYSVAYAASFGDPTLTDDVCKTLNAKLQNFKAFGLREEQMVPYVKKHTNVPVQRVIDPTLLLTQDDYNSIVAPRQCEENYLLLYARRYNPEMEAYAERIAAQKGLKIIEISLRATNAEKHKMFYEAGVEEFLSLVKYADFVVTNSFHGMIFSVQYEKPFAIFSRYQCNNKIDELLSLFGLSEHMLTKRDQDVPDIINYKSVHANVKEARDRSIEFLKLELYGCK